MKNKEYREIKFEHFHNLVAIAMADGYLDEAEKEFLSEKAEEIGLPEEEVSKLLKKAPELEFIVPINMAENEDQLADIVYIMMVDGNINQREYDLCLNIAKKLDLNQKDLDYIIELTKELWEKEDS